MDGKLGVTGANNQGFDGVEVEMRSNPGIKK